jgi:glycosyltransferase involved in cell wall biosynthesis
VNVVLVNDFAFVHGGASKVAIGSALALAESGVDIHFFSGSGTPDPRLEAAGVRVKCLEHEPYRNRGAVAGFKTGIWDQDSAEAFKVFLEPLDKRDTVVHIHTHREVLSASVPETAMNLGFPVVFTAHEYFLGCPYGAFFDQRHNRRCPLHGLSLSCITSHCNPGLYVRKFFALARARKHRQLGIPNGPVDIICVSDFSQRVLEPYFSNETRVHRVDNPLEVVRSERRATAGTSEFVVIGNLHPGKNPVASAKAAKEAGVPITFAGEGELKEEILAANPEAKLLGWQNAEHIQELLQRARALIFVPIWPETQGLAVWEAAARGVPSIVSNACAASDFVRNAGGIAVDLQQEGSLVSAIEQLKDDAYAESLSSHVYNAVWANPPSMEKHVKDLCAVYEGMLRKASG